MVKDKYNSGIHTINSIENITVVDGKRNILNLDKFKHIVSKRIFNNGNEKR